MAIPEVPPKAITTRELLRLARKIERERVQRRKLLVKVAELDASIRSSKRLFTNIAELVGAPTEDDVSSGECTCNRALLPEGQAHFLHCPARIASE